MQRRPHAGCWAQCKQFGDPIFRSRISGAKVGCGAAAQARPCPPRAFSDGMCPESEVRNRLRAGASRIRTGGPILIYVDQVADSPRGAQRQHTRIRRRHTKVALSAVRAHRGSKGDLADHKVDVTVATGGTAGLRAAKEATSTIPVVFVTGNDPVEAGLVASLARPRGNQYPQLINAPGSETGSGPQLVTGGSRRSCRLTHTASSSSTRQIRPSTFRSTGSDLNRLGTLRRHGTRVAGLPTFAIPSGAANRRLFRVRRARNSLGQSAKFGQLTTSPCPRGIAEDRR
jgi:hypothetical protein